MPQSSMNISLPESLRSYVESRVESGAFVLDELPGFFRCFLQHQKDRLSRQGGDRFGVIFVSCRSG